MLSVLFFHGFLFVGLLLAYGRWLDEEASADVCLFALAVELLSLSLATRYVSVTDSILFLHCGSLVTSLPSWGFTLLFCFDELSGFFAGILTFALLVCFMFLAEYFEYDAGASSITLLSALFSQAALLYFSAFDLILLVFFWELISLISFFLVQHWAFRTATYKAGLKVFTISQLGDLPLFAFIFLALERVGASGLPEVLSVLPLLSFEFLACTGALVNAGFLWGLLLSAAVFLKAAQFIFYPWLLDAMQAPVPISAQLHSSTLVVIGFYLFFRFQALYLLAPALGQLFVLAGLLTVVGASVLGFFQDDGKRLLACSTASQLGYVVVGLGVGLYEEALLLLAFCCCNKAFTFVWFGALMRRFSGMSDLRQLGGAGSLAWVEHAGLAVSLLNFTVCPGAFSWHVKSLFVQGQLLASTPTAAFGLDVLQLTWFFSSLYLVALYVALFMRAGRSAASQASPTSASLLDYSRKWASPHFAVNVTSALFAGVMLTAEAFVVWYSAGWFLVVADVSWGVQPATLSYF